MRFLDLLVGRSFQGLLQQVKEERFLSRPLSELPRQNPYPVAALLPLFLVAFALNLLPFLSMLPGWSPLHHALSF